jgi:hypothetical protein
MFRAVTALLVTGLFTLCGSTKLSETNLTGTWRAETTDVVKEIALRNDHTFTSWLSAKNALTTPSCPTSAGEWKLENRQIVVHFTNHIAVDGWERENEQRRFTIVKSTRDTLQLLDPEEKPVLSYKRLFVDYTVRACTRVPVDQDLFGSWRVHYNTHDYEIVFGRDHRFGIFANMPNWRQPVKGDVRKQLWRGTWHVADGKLLTAAKTVPSFQGELIETRHSQWQIIGIEPGRIAVRDGPVRYVWQRLN